MDVHTVAGATADAVADAHRKDQATQRQYGVTYLRYWLHESRGKIFCLAEALTAQAAERVHREAHKSVADEIYQIPERSSSSLARSKPVAPGLDRPRSQHRRSREDG